MNSMGIPGAAEPVPIPIHVLKISQDKKVKLAPNAISKKSMCCQVPTGISAHVAFGTGGNIKWVWTSQQHPATQRQAFCCGGKKIIQRVIATLAICYRNQPKGEFLPKSLFHVPHSPAELQKQQTLKSCRQLSSLKLL